MLPDFSTICTINQRALPNWVTRRRRRQMPCSHSGSSIYIRRACRAESAYYHQYFLDLEVNLGTLLLRVALARPSCKVGLERSRAGGLLPEPDQVSLAAKSWPPAALPLPLLPPRPGQRRRGR